MKRFLSLLLASSIALAPLPSFASNEADAKDLFVKGRDLRAKGDCAGAIPLFKKAHELFPAGLGSLRNLAECEEAVGRWASARRNWLDLKRALLVNKDSKYDGWEADADAAAKRLEPKVPHVTISVAVKGPDGEGPIPVGSPIRVLVNGQPIQIALLDTPLDRDPGDYTVRVEGGKEPVEKIVALGAGDSKTLRFVVELPSSSTADPGETSSGSSGMKTAGWVTLGLGVAAGVGAGVTFMMRRNALNDLEASCPNYATGPCPASSRDAIDRGKSAALLTNILGGVAIVGVGVGIALVVAGSGKSSESKSSLHVSPWAGPGGGGAVLGGAF